MKTVKDFPVGTYVQSKSVEGANHFGKPFVGTVVGITLNLYGEPTLKLHMVTRRVGSVDNMIDLGLTQADQSVEIWERTGGMHPGNVEPLKDNCVITV